MSASKIAFYLKALSNVLTTEDLPEESRFFAEDELTSDDINIEVDGVGRLNFPLSNDSVEKLISTSVKYGFSEQTALDQNVHDIPHVIERGRLKVSIDQAASVRILDKTRCVLGIENKNLTAHLHNMLIYQSGQFLDVHEDSEKVDNKAATLLIVLPKAHIGGDLIIKHRKEMHTFSSERLEPLNAKCISFYAGCQCSVQKIKEGHRIALTFNLVLNSEEILPYNVNDSVIKAIKAYFDDKLDQGKQQRLVHLLNHSYTEQSLRWDMLKEEDETMGLLFCSMSKNLGLIAYLALIEITVFESYNSDDLSSFYRLTYLIDLDNREVMKISGCDISDSEISLTNEDFEPYEVGDSQYVPFSEERNYLRAAIVLCTDSCAISMNFSQNYTNALKDLCLLTDNTGNENRVKETVVNAGKHLHLQYILGDPSYFVKFINIGLYVKSKEIAFSILCMFKWSVFNCSGKFLADLQHQYSTQWCIELIKKIKSNSTVEFAESLCVLDKLQSVIQTFLDCGGDSMITDILLNTQCEALITEKNIRNWISTSKRSQNSRLTRLYETYLACVLTQSSSICEKITKYVISNPDVYPLESVIQVILYLQGNTTSNDFVHKFLKCQVLKSIDYEIALNKDNWSVEVELSCECEHCKIAMNFLRSKDEKMQALPFEESIYSHLTDQFSGLDLPVELAVKQTGPTRKLHLKKTEALLKEREQQYNKFKGLQEKLLENLEF